MQRRPIKKNLHPKSEGKGRSFEAFRSSKDEPTPKKTAKRTGRREAPPARTGTRNPSPIPVPSGDSFSEILKHLAFPKNTETPIRTGAEIAEPLAELDYSFELKVKNEALRTYWKSKGLPDKPNLILPSPKPRGYRTTSKRRLLSEGGRITLDFKHPGPSSSAKPLGSVSALEPAEHARIYEFVLSKLSTPAYSPLAKAMNFIVIRGDYTRFAVILNVFRTSGDIVRKAKLLAGQLEREKDFGVVASWLYFGAGDSPFYLDQSAPKGPWKAKRLSGPETFSISIGEMRYAFHPLGFSQINLSLLPALVADTVAALKVRQEDRFLDLYCGYGLFSLAVGKEAGEIIGIDAAEKAIPTARSMAAARKLTHIRYIRETIHARNLTRWLPPAGNKPEVILLDPPKSGAGAGVIRALAARSPRRVVQLFCGVEAMQADCDAWRRAGYMLAKAVPYDMFPGTDEVEVMAVFVPDKFGLLNRIPADRKPR